MDAMTDFNELIPELAAWNNGEGIDPESWISNSGRFDLAVGYSTLFWPRFEVHDGYVLREGFSEKSLGGFEKAPNSTRQSIEWVMNHIHIEDVHSHIEASEAQLIFLGNLLCEIHRVKLSHEFPDRQFRVEFNGEPNLNHEDYQMSFWQKS